MRWEMKRCNEKGCSGKRMGTEIDEEVSLRMEECNVRVMKEYSERQWVQLKATRCIVGQNRTGDERGSEEDVNMEKSRRYCKTNNN